MKKDLFGGFPGGRFIGEEELAGVTRVVRSRSPYRFYGLKPQRESEAAEELCRKLFGRRYALVVSSGTAALHAALFALDIRPGYEVIMPAYGWIANLMSVIALGGVPVITPVDETLGLDPSFIKKAATKKTKAIVAVHMRGYPCDLKKIMVAGRGLGIKVIEDGSQCIGGGIGGAPVGSLGDISVLSFQYNKLVTSGEGGAVLTDDKRLYEKAYRFHDLGMFRRVGEADPEGLNSITSFGLNYRLSELQAAVLLAQLKKMPFILKKLKKNHGLAAGKISAICRRFSLGLRESVAGCEPNYAFLCLSAKNRHDAGKASIALGRLKVPVQRPSRLDGHNFNVWKNFMLREGIAFRSVGDGRSGEILKRALYVEINSA